MMSSIKDDMVRMKISNEEYSQVLSQLDSFRGKPAVMASSYLNKPNKKHIAMFMLVMCLANMASQAGMYMSVCTPLFIHLYKWGPTASD